MKLILFQSLWLAHAPHGPQPVQQALKARPGMLESFLALQTHKPASTTGHLSGVTLPVLQPTPLGSVASPVDISTVSTSSKTYHNARICMAGDEGGRFTFSPYVIFPFKKYQNHPMEISTKQLFFTPMFKIHPSN